MTTASAAGTSRRACRCAGAPTFSSRCFARSLPFGRAWAVRSAFRSSAARSGAVGRVAGSSASAVSTAATSRRGSPRRSEASGGAPASIARATSWIGIPQNGWRSVRVSQRSTPTDHTSLCGRRVGTGEALWCDVGECARHVADRGQRVGAVELGEAEVEEPDRELVAVLDENVGGFHVAVDDSRAVRVCERVEHLRCDLHGVTVGERARPDRLAQRPSGHVLVGDVDVARVMADVVRAHAAVVPQSSCRERLALRASGRLPLPRDDLQRDVQARPLVEREPDRARAAASERAHGSVATENEVLGGWDCRNRRHRVTVFATARKTPWSAGPEIRDFRP